MFDKIGPGGMFGARLWGGKGGLEQIVRISVHKCRYHCTEAHQTPEGQSSDNGQQASGYLCRAGDGSMKYAMEGVESVHARIEFDFVYACYVH